MIPALTALCFRGAGKATERMVGAALDTGLEPRAILEVFIQSALYSGLPRTEEALEIAGRYLPRAASTCRKTRWTSAPLNRWMPTAMP
jgi:alkylhydroperoxidase/carboxymuconolactone decarboxylase family protein YurZ